MTETNHTKKTKTKSKGPAYHFVDTDCKQTNKQTKRTDKASIDQAANKTLIIIHSTFQELSAVMPIKPRLYGKSDIFRHRF